MLTTKMFSSGANPNPSLSEQEISQMQTDSQRNVSQDNPHDEHKKGSDFVGAKHLDYDKVVNYSDIENLEPC